MWSILDPTSDSIGSLQDAFETDKADFLGDATNTPDALNAAADMLNGADR